MSRAKTLHEQLKQQQQQKLNFKQNNTGNSDSAPQPQQIHSLMYDWQQVLLRLMDKDLESNIGIKDLRLLRSLLHDWLTTTLPMAALTTANLAAVADMDFVLVYDTCAFLVSLLIIDSRQTSPIATSSSISSSSSPTVTFLATTVMTRYLPLIYSALIRLAYEEEEGGEGEQDAAASSGGGERNVADSSHSLRTYKTLAADLCERLFQG